VAKTTPGRCRRLRIGVPATWHGQQSTTPMLWDYPCPKGLVVRRLDCEPELPPLGIPPRERGGGCQVASRRSMRYTEAGSPPANCTISGLRGLNRSRHPLEPLWCLGQDNSESPAGGDRSNGGVAPSSTRHADESSTSKYPNPAVRYRGKSRRLRPGGGHAEPSRNRFNGTSETSS